MGDNYITKRFIIHLQQILVSDQSRMTRCMAHVARMRLMSTVYKMLHRKPEGTGDMGDINVDGRMIIK
jgi:hypothetical protein